MFTDGVFTEEQGAREASRRGPENACKVFRTRLARRSATGGGLVRGRPPRLISERRGEGVLGPASVDSEVRSRPARFTFPEKR